MQDKSIKREKDRERQRRKSKQGTFEESMKRPGRPLEVSDSGRAAALIRQGCDENLANFYLVRQRRAIETVRRRCPEAMQVLLLVLKHGANRKTSIDEMCGGDRSRRNACRMRYNRHLDKLLKLFERPIELRLVTR